ncbi:hypothetical protein Trydic_g6365 [Trypoxylus dichotomus]
MFSLIYQCETGHSICIACRDPNMCPTCEGLITATRNHSLESLRTLLSYPCLYRSGGCQKVLHYDRYQKHVALCEYKTRSCIFCPEDDVWRGPLKELKQHLLQSHMQYILELGRPYFLYSNYLPTTGNKVTLFFIHQGYLFYFYVICDAANVVYLYIQQIGKKDESTRYIYKITFGNEHESHKHRTIHYTMECLDDTRTIADGLRMGHYCAIPQRALLNYTNITCMLNEKRNEEINLLT